jgi:hypothetical protein
MDYKKYQARKGHLLDFKRSGTEQRELEWEG